MLKIISLLACSLSLGGCVLTIGDIIPAADARFDERLLGDWQEVDGADRVTLTRDAQGYRIEYFEGDGNVSEFYARLGRIGDRSILDVTPAADASDQTPALFLPAHLLIALDISRDSVGIAALESDTLRRRLTSGGLKLPHVLRDGNVILTDDSSRLRAALTRYMLQPGVWTEPTAWRRTGSDPGKVRRASIRRSLGRG